MTNVPTPFTSLPLTVGSLTGSEIVPCDQGGTTKQTTAAAIAATIATRGPYANNAAAIAAGLAVGAVYYTATGEMRVVV